MEANHARTGVGTKRARPLAGRAGVASFASSEEAVESSSCFSSASVVFGSSSDPASDAFAEAARAAQRARAREGATRRVPNVARGGGAARRPRTRATGRATTATANIFKI